MTSRSRMITATTVLAFAGTLCAAPASSAAPRTPAPRIAVPAQAGDTVTVNGTSYTKAELARLAQPTNRAELAKMLDVIGFSPAHRAKIDALLGKLPEDRLNALLNHNSEGSEAVRNRLLSVLDPSDYACTSTPLNDFVDSLLPDPDNIVEFFAVIFYSIFGLLDVQAYEAMLYAQDRPVVVGVNNSHGKVLGKTLSQAKKFWDIPSDDIFLAGMDPDLWQRIDGDSPSAKAAFDRAAMGLGVRFGGNTTDPKTLEVGREFLTLFNGVLQGDYVEVQMPSMKDGRNDLFTFNAFAFTVKGDPTVVNDPYVSKLEDRIIFGNGIINGLNAVGLGAEGPQAVMAHEFGHHVQYENDVVFGAPTKEEQPEATRRTELMADALGSYFATHKRGLTLNAKRVAQVSATFYNVGDCGFTEGGHHGTPAQRDRASLWGSDLAASAQKQGHILPSATVITRFDAALPELVRPDAQ